MARMLFVDYPLGNPTGKPYDIEDQRSIVALALDVLESARFARTTVQAPNRWHTEAWREAFMAVTDDNRAVLAAAGERRRAKQAERAARS